MMLPHFLPIYSHLKKNGIQGNNSFSILFKNSLPMVNFTTGLPLVTLFHSLVYKLLLPCIPTGNIRLCLEEK